MRKARNFPSQTTRSERASEAISETALVSMESRASLMVAFSRISQIVTKVWRSTSEPKRKACAGSRKDVDGVAVRTDFPCAPARDAE